VADFSQIQIIILFKFRQNLNIGNYLAIVAPYSGIITKRNIVVGSLVDAPTIWY